MFRIFVLSAFLTALCVVGHILYKIIIKRYKLRDILKYFLNKKQIDTISSLFGKSKKKIIHEYEETIDSQKATIDDLNKKVNQLQEKSNEYELMQKKQKQMEKDYNKRLEKLKYDFSQREKTLEEKFSEEIEKILSKNKLENNSFIENIKYLKEQLFEKEKNIEDILKQNNTLLTQRKNNEIKIQKLEEEINTLETQEKNKEIKIKGFEEEIDILKAQEKDKETKIKGLEEEINILEAQKEDKEIKIKELEGEIKVLKEKLSRLSEYEKFDIDKFILSTGKYKGSIDVPIGIYNIRIVHGSGFIETDTPDNLYFHMSIDEVLRREYGWVEKYKNLEISEKTILKISDNAEIEFMISKQYDFLKETEEMKEEFEAEKKILNGELSVIKQELKTLNDELIKKYYKFSDYEKFSSDDCKNKLILLKQEEKELREKGEDVIVQNKYKNSNKIGERIIRQMLRTFNAECDNIIQNISLKNIDKVRKQLQNSFETINKLYYVDSAILQRKLLELKLNQATLIYTYELKKQQEKDIQKAIKEQMMEEARAEKEIQEQKKKVEKDLQQHLGEVNRLMKYMQKTQIDAERQLYMDKIQELEERIKELESDKEAVLKREANSKAGFVYVISNIGSFGEGIYKIGMTRRLEPMDRIKELSSASVPFEFDVHAMIFSSDAPELETTLHRHFADKAVNKVNPRKEFYRVDIDEIEKVVKENYNDTVQFTKIPIATEYRQSIEVLK